MKETVYHEGYNYVVEYGSNTLIMYKEDTDEWMGDIAKGMDDDDSYEMGTILAELAETSKISRI